MNTIDWMGVESEWRYALVDPALARCAKGDADPAAEGAAYRAAVAWGRSQLFGVKLGDWDGVLESLLARAAARRLTWCLEHLKLRAAKLAEFWNRADTDIEAREESLSLLESRMDAWAVFVALDEAQLDALTHTLPGRAELSAECRQAQDALAQTDAALREQADFLSVAAGTQLLDNWRRLLVEPYRLSSPWWLDGSLERVAERLWMGLSERRSNHAVLPTRPVRVEPVHATAAHSRPTSTQQPRDTLSQGTPTMKTPAFTKTKPSLMEAGLPCSSLSAECQRDNNARQRPPQNRLHIWWARRPPTICRVGILSALLPHDIKFNADHLPATVAEPTAEDLDELPGKYQSHREFFEQLRTHVGRTPLSASHQALLRAMGVTGDSDRAYRRMAARLDYLIGNKPILLPMNWTYRHPPAFAVTPNEDLLKDLLAGMRSFLGLNPTESVVMLDFMAGGGAIPLEGIRHGLKVFSNDLNPVASLVQKATLEYPAKFGRTIVPIIQKYAKEIGEAVRKRLLPFFYTEPAQVWWEAEKERAKREFKSKEIVERAPAARDSTKNCYLWCRTIACPRCGLNIPLSTNFHIVTKKGKPEASIAAFPEVPAIGKGNDCTFRIVGVSEWGKCRWPRLGTEPWHPTDTPTFSGGAALCPRCETGNHVIPEDVVKRTAQARSGGLPCQMYAVVSQVPVKLSYRNSNTSVRYLWRFRPPTKADLDAVRAAEQEFVANEARWASLIPTEAIEEGDKTREPRNVGITRWRDLFLPRQLLTAATVLDEVRAAARRARAELPAEQAEAVAVYLAFIVSKVVNYNSVNTFWHYGRKTVTQTFSRHDFAFRPAFCEFEGARETVMWGASQVINAYTQLAGLIHGEAVSLEGDDDEDAGEDEAVEEAATDEETDTEPQPAATAAATPSPADVHLRPEVVVPTVTNNDAAALETPAPGTVHLICVDPPYYNNVQYSELSNFFYVWLKRALGDWPGLDHLFREELAETNREAVANAARWKNEAEREEKAWQARYDAAYAALEGVKGDNNRKLPATERRRRAAETAGPEPLGAADRAEQFYEGKMAAVFRRAKQLLHPAGRMVVMFNHKMTKAWRALGKALIEAGFEIRTSIPVHTEAESSLNIRGLDAARSTVLLLCLPRNETEGVVGNWQTVQGRVELVARNAADRFQKQGITGTDLYLSALGPTLGEVGRHWPITDLKGDPIDLTVALEKAYAAVGRFRLEQILAELGQKAADAVENFAADTADRNTQALWLWLDTFQGDAADSDDVRRLAKALDIEPDVFKKMRLIEVDKETFYLQPPQDVDLMLLSRQLAGEKVARGRAAREADDWEERSFTNFIGAAVWNAISIMAGGDEMHKGVEPLKKWLRESACGGFSLPEFRGAFAVTLHLLEQAFARRKDDDPWRKATVEARRAWDLVVRDQRG